MVLYILNFLSLIVYDRMISNKKKIVLAFSLQLFLILALRSSTLGNDLDSYVQYFEHYQQYSFWKILASTRLLSGSAIPWGMESGYVLLNWIIGKLGFGFHGFLVIHAAICIASVSVFIYRYSKDVPLSYALFLALGGFSYFFGILRQSLGLAVFLFAIPALTQRKAVRYFAWVLLAVLFHRICILLVPLYFFADMQMTRKKSLYIVGISVLIAIITPLLGRFVIAPLLTLIGKGGTYSVGIFQWNNMFLLMIALFVGAVFVLYDGVRKNHLAERTLTWMMAFTLPVQALAFYMPIFSRAAMGLFLPAGYILTANAVRYFPDKQKKTIIRWGLFFALFAFYIYITHGDVITPYRWVFSGS